MQGQHAVFLFALHVCAVLLFGFRACARGWGKACRLELHNPQLGLVQLQTALGRNGTATRRAFKLRAARARPKGRPMGAHLLVSPTCAPAEPKVGELDDEAPAVVAGRLEQRVPRLQVTMEDVDAVQVCAPGRIRAEHSQPRGIRSGHGLVRAWHFKQRATARLVSMRTAHCQGSDCHAFCSCMAALTIHALGNVQQSEKGGHLQVQRSQGQTRWVLIEWHLLACQLPASLTHPMLSRWAALETGQARV